MLARFKAPSTLLKSSWTEAMSLIYPVSLMQEHPTEKVTTGNGFYYFLLERKKNISNFVLLKLRLTQPMSFKNQASK